MDYPMLQPQIEYKTEEYSFEIKEDICRITAYGFLRADRILLVPDGCGELIMAWGFDGGYCVYPDKTVRAWLEPPAGCKGLCGVRVEPGFTINITKAVSNEIQTELAAAQNPSEARCIILRRVMPCIGRRRVSSVWQRMAETVCETRGRHTVAELAEEYGYTVRHVNNLFRECAGYSPKTFCRFVRFQNALDEMMKNPGMENSCFIERLSYADQAHFQREFKEFTGITPRQFIRGIFEEDGKSVSFC